VSGGAETVACPACRALHPVAATHCAGCGAPLPALAGGALQRGDTLHAGRWSRLSRICGWCDARTAGPLAERCASCGGPLPALPPRILAELQLPAPASQPPPDAPRGLPRGYEMRVRYWKNVAVMIGMAFTVLFGWTVIFALAGVPLWVHGHRKASRWIRALVHGAAVEGTITRVFVDVHQAIDHKNPWQVDYRFETPAGTVEGHVTSWDPLTAQRRAGERVWVVYDPRAPAASALWPPVA